MQNAGSMPFVDMRSRFANAKCLLSRMNKCETLLGLKNIIECFLLGIHMLN